MKTFFAYLLLGGTLLIASSLQAQDKSKRASPPAKVSEKIASGATITIDYSRPSLKGRTVGQTVEPMKGQVWRMGANEATVFATDKNVTIDGQALPAGKYALFGLWGDDGYTLIFNKAYSIWGTEYEKNKDQDALKVVVRPRRTDKTQEQLLYTINKKGDVSLLWGTMAVDFQVR
ncbi:MAG TPA: DUF2911 domain-containing protein [Flavisolibacter sp.]|nr:DUF2911 domain-containing protein [Flavisolibacter sp.]